MVNWLASNDNNTTCHVTNGMANVKVRAWEKRVGLACMFAHTTSMRMETKALIWNSYIWTEPMMSTKLLYLGHNLGSPYLYYIHMYL